MLLLLLSWFSTACIRVQTCRVFHVWQQQQWFVWDRHKKVNRVVRQNMSPLGTQTAKAGEEKKQNDPRLHNVQATSPPA